MHGLGTIIILRSIIGINKISGSSPNYALEKKEHLSKTLEHFKKHLRKGMSYDKVKILFGEPDSAIGSGIHIFKYVIEDKKEIWLGFADLENMLYAKLVDGRSKSDILK